MWIILKDLGNKKMINVDVNACEFGYELCMVLPYVYHHFEQKNKINLRTCSNMKPFYYFLPENSVEYHYEKRRSTLPIGTKIRSLHEKNPDRTEWLCPSYKTVYEKYSLNIEFKKPLLLISNKYTDEWGQEPVNYLSTDCLDKLFESFSQNYDIIYNRVKSKNIIGDDQNNLDLNESSLLKKYENVYDMNEILEKEDYDFNTLQLIILSKAENKISVQGGTSILSSLTGGNNLVYAVKGGELSCDAYTSWYKDFSGCSVKNFSSYDSLIQSAEELF